MRALLLAAGFGTRLRPITASIPKCLVAVHEKPLLAYWLEILRQPLIERILVNTHYLADKVEAYVRSSPWRDRIDLVHEETILGTGGTVRANRTWLNGESFLVAHADNLTIFDPAQLIARHAQRPRECVMTMMTFDTDSPQTCGIVEERQGVVIDFHEKVPNPPGRRANAAVYVFAPEIFEFLSQNESPIIDLSTEVLPHFLGRIWTFHNDRYHRDIGNIEALRLAEREFPR
ncbi:MAG: nucleotidyltransferase family protein [Burkholderiales bacterium]